MYFFHTASIECKGTVVVFKSVLLLFSFLWVFHGWVGEERWRGGNDFCKLIVVVHVMLVCFVSRCTTCVALY